MPVVFSTDIIVYLLVIAIAYFAAGSRGAGR